MKKMTTQEVQQVSTEILVYVDKICREHQIEYSIFYGSLIGVERHQGYIPWDDDLDIVLTRPNYDKLIKILSIYDEYLLLSLETTKKYRYTFAKLVDKRTRVKTKQFYSSEDDKLGVFVDIFPIDGFPDSKEKRKILGEKCELYRSNMLKTLNHSYAISKSWWRAILKRIFLYPEYKRLVHSGGYTYWEKKYLDETVSYPIEIANYCGYMEFIKEKWGVFPIEWFESYEDVNFENYKVRAIKNRKEFLSLRYDDYMKLPDEKDRMTHHPYTFFWNSKK